MERLIKASQAERTYLFHEAAKGGLSQSTVLEKDFLVSWTYFLKIHLHKQ